MLLQGGLEQCGKGRDMEKENVDPAPKVKHPRLPRAKKVCTCMDVASMCFGEDRTRLPSYHAPYAEFFYVVCALCCSLALQVGISPLIHSHPPDAEEDAELEQCTQIPITRARVGLKRLMKHGRMNASADVGETTPQRRCKSMKVPTLDCPRSDAMLQTPMPESVEGSDFGPPPPDTTPFHQRRWINFQPFPP